VERDLVDGGTRIATTIHPAQLLHEELPETAHDFRVDLIVTPGEVIRTRRVKRRTGILWDALDDAKAAGIPVLRERVRP
jgi:5-formyltetrahydrofolate cyclo-ligase